MSLEQYKDANRKELWEILQIQVERIAELENQWISVQDRLPELEDNSVLVYFTTTSIETVHIEDNFKDIPNGFDKEGNQLYTKWYICSGITHWMPLPEPPKEKE